MIDRETNQTLSDPIKTEQKARRSGIELLRLLCALGIIVLHYCNKDMGGAFLLVAPHTAEERLLVFLKALCIASVNTLVMISGYFICRSKSRRFSKVLRLFIQISVFNLIYYVIRLGTGLQHFTVKSMLADMIPINYFITLYCAVYMISPYLDRVMWNLLPRNRKKLLLTAFLVFSVWSYFVDLMEIWIGVGLYGLNSIGLMGSGQGCTFVNFLLAYMFGSYIRMSEPSESSYTLIGFAAALILILYIWASSQLFAGRPQVCWNYNNPLCLLLAAIWLMLFLRLDFSSKVINELAKSVFSCVLGHIFFLRYLNIPGAVTAGWSKLLLHIVLSCILLYFATYVIHKVYFFIADRTFHRLIDKVDRVVSLSLDE